MSTTGHGRRFIVSRQLDDEPPPAWVIRDTKLPKIGTTGPTETTWPDVHSGEVLPQVGGGRDKGKSRDTGNDEFTEGDRTAVSRSADKQTRDSAHNLVGWRWYGRRQRQKQRNGSTGVGG